MEGVYWMAGATVGRVAEDGRTLQLTLPADIISAFGLKPGMEIMAATLSDGRVLVSLQGSLEQINRTVLDLVCDTDGPDANEVVEASRSAQRTLGGLDR